MNKKEISEIKKLFSDRKCCINNICGCLVNGNKEKLTTFRQSFSMLPDEEIFKYFTIFKKALSGTIGKSLRNLEFGTDAEAEGTTHADLMKLRETNLTDDSLLDTFYNRIIDNYYYGENYLILLINAKYDVPGRTTDSLDVSDSSVYVYDHLFCCICPVKLSDDGLCYNEDNKSIENRVRDWLVEVPAHAFLFPAFNDRNTDIHAMLYYSKNSESIQSDFIGGMFDCVAPMTPKTQKSAFSEIISESLAEDTSFESIKAINGALNSYCEEHKEDPDTTVFDKSALRQVLIESGAREETVSRFDEKFDDVAGSKTAFAASNVVNSKNFDIKTPVVSVKIQSDRLDLIKTKQIDGKGYIMIEITDDVTINGLPVPIEKMVKNDQK